MIFVSSSQDFSLYSNAVSHPTIQIIYVQPDKFTILQILLKNTAGIDLNCSEPCRFFQLFCVHSIENYSISPFFSVAH